MNILWFNHRDPWHPQAGGAEVRIKELSKRLVKSGFNVKLVCERWNGSKQTDYLEGIEIVRISNRFGIHFIVPFAIAKFRNDFDVVIDDIAHAVPWFSSFFTSKPVIGQVHHVHQKVLASELSPILAKIIALSEAQIKRIYTNLIVVSESTKKDLVLTMGVREQNIDVVSNGISSEFFKPTEKSFEPRLLWVGRLKKYKRIDHILYAFRKILEVFPNAELFIVGEGDQLEFLKKQCNDFGLSKVIFTGKVSEEEKIRIMGSSWVFVSTSTVEGWGLTIIESAACGTPTIAYDVAGLRDSVQDGITGFLVPDGDHESLAEQIIEVLKNSSIRLKLSENALNHAKTFSWEKAAKQFIKVLEGVMNEC